jgi:hypothetical protein
MGMPTPESEVAAAMDAGHQAVMGYYGDVQSAGQGLDPEVASDHPLSNIVDGGEVAYDDPGPVPMKAPIITPDLA